MGDRFPAGKTFAIRNGSRPAAPPPPAAAAAPGAVAHAPPQIGSVSRRSAGPHPQPIIFPGYGALEHLQQFQKKNW